MRALDVEAMAVHRASLDEALACLDEPIARDVALIAHRALASSHFAEGNWKAAGLSLAAVRQLAGPGWKPNNPDPEHPLVLRWAELQSFEEERVPITERALPPDGLDGAAWLVDGEERADVPGNRAFVAQAVHDGDVLWTGYVLDPRTLPGPWAEVVEPRVTASMRKTRRTVTPIAAGGALVGTGLVVGGALVRGSISGDMTSAEAADRLSTANTVTGAGAATLGAALVGGGLAWTIRW